jgi:cytochrome c oxidase subunit 1
MIFFLVMPGLFGSFGNILIPLYLGAPEITYPRINNISVLIVPLSYCCIVLTMNREFTSGVGWTLYPPLSTALMNLSPLGMSLVINGLLLSGISSSLTSLNFFITLCIMRSCGSTLSYISVYV